MAVKGPIILVEDDSDDREIFGLILKEEGIKNELKWFRNTKDATEFLIETNSKPFLIFCDINLPGESGLEFKKTLDENREVRKKSIPFIFYSTAAEQSTVNTAYIELTIQGFFQKEANYSINKANIASIIDYWSRCKHPNME